MHSKESLKGQFERLGLEQGDEPVMVHASLHSVGPVEGGANGLLDALVDSLGPDGTVLMITAADDRVPFDPATTPADPEIGALAEVFRTRPGRRVNDNPACRFGASGPRSEELLEPCPLNDYYGPGSVLSRFADMRGRVLRLGSDPNTVTLTHWAEYLAEVPDKRARQAALCARRQRRIVDRQSRRFRRYRRVAGRRLFHLDPGGFPGHRIGQDRPRRQLHGRIFLGRRLRALRRQVDGAAVHRKAVNRLNPAATG